MPTTYDIHEDVKFAPLEVIEAGALVDQNKEPWWNQTLCQVNDAVARIGVFHGEFHWHKHDVEDELFFVLEGTLEIEIEGREPAVLSIHEGIMVPKGVRHRPKAPKGAVVLMVEQNTIVPTGS